MSRGVRAKGGLVAGGRSNGEDYRHGNVTGRVKLYAMGRIVKCRRLGCNNTFPKSEGRGRPKKFCRHACMIAAFRRRCKKVGKAPRPCVHDGNDEWYTPASVVGAARAVMGRIDLDPASNAEANETVKAKTIYTVEDDGLTQPWSGRVFLNPPFSAQVKRAFCDRLRESFASGDVSQAVAGHAH